MPEVSEQVINDKLAEILSELGVDARAERGKGGRRPDIRCHYKGLIVGIETSYEKKDAERDAEARVEQGLVDVAIALYIKERFRDVPEPELKEAVRRSKFDVRGFIPSEGRGALKAESATEWLPDVDIPTLKSVIEDSAELLLREREVGELLGDVRAKVDDFVKALEELDANKEIRKGIYDVLYRLYGLMIAEAEDPEVAFGHAPLSRLLSVTFYGN